MGAYFHFFGAGFLTFLLAFIGGGFMDKWDAKNTAPITVVWALFTLIFLIGLLGGFFYWLLGLL